MKTKVYLTTNNLINTIKSKGIGIYKEDEVKDILKNYNYYIIMGYKSLFIKDNKYKANIYFEDIFNLYMFDRKLKLLLLDSLLNIESIVKNSIINVFCNKYGFKEKDYLNKSNYNTTHKYLDKTMKIFEQQIKEKKNNTAVEYYTNTYGYVPYWVISKILSFGLIKELYAVMTKDDEKQILNSICNFTDTKVKHLYIQLQLLVDKRNKIAHDEIVFNDLHKRIILHKTNEHKKFDLKGNSGLNDTLGLLICIKNILPQKEFNTLIDNIEKLINDYIDNTSIKKEDLLKEMHLPLNYKILKW